MYTENETRILELVLQQGLKRKAHRKRLCDGNNSPRRTCSTPKKSQNILFLH
jgi:hypothetical protein